MVIDPRLKHKVKNTILFNLFEPMEDWIQQEVDKIVGNQPGYFYFNTRKYRSSFTSKGAAAPRIIITPKQLDALHSLDYANQQLDKDKETISNYLLLIFNKAAYSQDIFDALPSVVLTWFKLKAVPRTTDIDEVVNSILLRNMLL